MKIDVNAIFRAGGVACLELQRDEDGMELGRLDACLVHVTHETVAAARRPAAAEGSGAVEIDYGQVLAAISPGGGEPLRLRTIAADELSDFVLPFGGRDLALTGPDMLATREALAAAARRGALPANAARALGGLQSLFEMVAAAPDARRFSERLVALSYLASLSDGLPIDMEISAEDFAAKCRAQLMRARIGLVDPDHPDAIRSAPDLEDILRRAGVEAPSARAGVSTANVTASDLRRVAMAEEGLSRELFGALTETPVAELAAAAAPLDADDRLVAAGARRLEGAWIDRARETLAEVLSRSMPGYRSDMALLTSNGTDILVVRDEVGERLGVSYVYAWPSADRLPLARIGERRLLQVAPAEIPDRAEIDRLGRVLEGLLRRQALGPAEIPADFEDG